LYPIETLVLYTVAYVGNGRVLISLQSVERAWDYEGLWWTNNLPENREEKDVKTQVEFKCMHSVN